MGPVVDCISRTDGNPFRLLVMVSVAASRAGTLGPSTDAPTLPEGSNPIGCCAVGYDGDTRMGTSHSTRLVDTCVFAGTDDVCQVENQVLRVAMHPRNLLSTELGLGRGCRTVQQSLELRRRDVEPVQPVFLDGFEVGVEPVHVVLRVVRVRFFVLCADVFPEIGGAFAELLRRESRQVDYLFLGQSGVYGVGENVED